MGHIALNTHFREIKYDVQAARQGKARRFDVEDNREFCEVYILGIITLLGDCTVRIFCEFEFTV